MPVNSFDNYPMAWKPERAKLKKPLYQSLAAYLEADITSGFLLPDTKLPPQRELADFLDINFTTVTRAYKLCEEKGLIHAVVGKGTFVSPHSGHNSTISLSDSPHSVIDLAFIASFERFNALLCDSVRAVAASSSLPTLFDYSYPTGMPAHKRAAVSWLARYGYSADTERLSIVSGVQNGVSLSLIALFNAGDKIAVDPFTFPNFTEFARANHIRLVPVPSDTDGMRPDLLAEQARLNGVKGVFLMPNCNNPTTAAISPTRRMELARVIRDYGLILIEDDIYGFLQADTDNPVPPVSALASDNSVYICGTSKPIASGLRVGYMAYAERFKAALESALFNVNVKTSSLEAQIITELINSGAADTIVRRKLQAAKRANALFDALFPDAPKPQTPYSFFRILPVNSALRGIDAERFIEGYGVRVYHSDRFAVAAGDESKFLRVSLATAPDEAVLERGLLLLKTAVSQL